MRPVSLGWAIWDTKVNRIQRRRKIYRGKGVAAQYCRYKQVPIEVFATHYNTITEVPLDG